jgi:hypothetical protein
MKHEIRMFGAVAMIAVLIMAIIIIGQLIKPFTACSHRPSPVERMHCR